MILERQCWNPKCRLRFLGITLMRPIFSIMVLRKQYWNPKYLLRFLKQNIDETNMFDYDSRKTILKLKKTITVLEKLCRNSTFPLRFSQKKKHCGFFMLWELTLNLQVCYVSYVSYIRNLGPHGAKKNQNGTLPRPGPSLRREW